MSIETRYRLTLLPSWRGHGVSARLLARKVTSSSLVAGIMVGLTLGGKRVAEPAIALGEDRHFHEGLSSHPILLRPIVDSERTGHNHGYTRVV
jgi:hypothetical protein